MSCRSHHIFFYYYWAVLLCAQIIEYIMARWSYSFVCTLCFLLLIIIMQTYLKVVNFYNICQVHFVETRLKIWSIFSIIFIVIYWSVCIQLTHFSFDHCENRCTLSYYHYQIGSIAHSLLFRVRSWNNGMRCMSFYVHMNLWYGRIASWHNRVLAVFAPNLVLCHWHGAPGGALPLIAIRGCAAL